MSSPFDRKYYQGIDGFNNAITTSFIMVITMSIFVLGLFSNSFIRKILGTQTMQIILFSIVFISNFIAYYHDPTRYTTKPLCSGGLVNCNTFSVITGIATFVMDVMLFKSLLDKFSNNYLLTLIPLVLLGLLYIIHYWLTEEPENDSKNNNKKSKLPDLLSWNKRIMLYSFIMFLDIIIWFQGFSELSTGIGNSYNNITRPLFNEPIKKSGLINKNTSFINKIMGWDAKQEPRFGTNMFNRIMGWGGILGFLFFDLIAVAGQLSYEPKNYGLDNHVD